MTSAVSLTESDFDCFPVMIYCKYGNFRENYIFANSVKIHICDGKKSGLRQDLPLSVNDIVISAFCEDFILTKLREVSRI